MPARVRGGLVGIGLAVACGGAWEEVSWVDEGDLCIREAAGALVAEVSAPDCLSSGCSRDVEATCTASVEGTEIRITSDISWEAKTGRGARCDADCGIATATCTIGALADGTYTVLFDGTRQLAVPIGDPGCPL